MVYRCKTRDEHLENDGSPKRILALDGGGLKGILTLGILRKIEEMLGRRHGDTADFRLCHYFDLIAGTSTGSIIAATLALGWSVEEIRKRYMMLGEKIFEKSLLRKGFLRAKYDETKLNEELKKVYGADTKLGSPDLQTGLLVMTKRIDTGSPWPITNNSRGRYFSTRPEGTIGNGDYPLWRVVRASTAAPAYFDPENITITAKQGLKPVVGQFVDGGVSPYNNPAFQAMMYATMSGYRLNWPVGPDRLLIVSVGTGMADPSVKKTNIAAKHAVSALLSLMDDCGSLQEMLLQWMSACPTSRHLDREIGDLCDEFLGGKPLLTYLRYNVDLRKENVQKLAPDVTDPETIQSLSAMDAPENMEILHRLGKRAAEQDVRAGDFPAAFDLP